MPFFDGADRGLTRIQFELVAGGWTLLNPDPAVALRVNGRLVRERPVRDGDIIGCGKSLMRFSIIDAGPAASAPRRTITLDDAPRFAPRQKGLSTVVTAPGQWSDVVASWYGGTVLHLQGPEDPHPEHLIARLGQRIRCYTLLPAGFSTPYGLGIQPQHLSADAPLLALNEKEQSHRKLIGDLWNAGLFTGVLSPLEPEILAAVLRSLLSLLAVPTALRPLLYLPEAALVDGLRAAEASLLFKGAARWELFCCPEILPLWRRLGLPDRQTPGWDYVVNDCDDGFVRISGTAATPPALVAKTLATRDTLHLLLDADIAEIVPENIHSREIAGGRRGTRRLLGPTSGDARFELIDRFWGRGGIVGLLASRNDEEIADLAMQLPGRVESESEPFGEHDRDRLGGFDAVLYDPADSTWAVFADPRPKPVWQRYGLPAPMLNKSI